VERKKKQVYKEKIKKKIHRSALKGEASTGRKKCQQERRVKGEKKGRKTRRQYGQQCELGRKRGE
jgi:hypothetical protein